MILDYIRERYGSLEGLTPERLAIVYREGLKDKGLQILKVNEGFITYKLEGDAVIWWDAYVKPEFRMKGIGRRLSESLEKLGRLYGKRVLFSFSAKQGKNQEAGIYALKAVGFNQAYELKDMTVFIKGI